MRIKNAELAAKLAAFGLSGRELARLCQVHPNTVSALLNLRRNPKPETARAIAAALGCRAKDLFPADGRVRP